MAASPAPNCWIEALKLMNEPRSLGSALPEMSAMPGPKRPVTRTKNSTAHAMTTTSETGPRCVVMRIGAIDSTPSATWRCAWYVVLHHPQSLRGIAVFAVIKLTGTLTYASWCPAGGAWGVPTLLSAPNDKGGVSVAGDPAGTFVVIWNDAAGNVQAVTAPPGGEFGPGTPVGASPSRRLLVPGKAVLWTAAGISTEPV